MPGTLVAGATVGDVRQAKLRDGVGAGEPAGDGGTDGAETKDADLTAAGTVAGRLKRVETHARSVIPEGENRKQEVLSAHTHTWIHVGAGCEVRGCVGAVLSAGCDVQGRSQVLGA